MKLYLLHGREDIDVSLDDWGPDGPTLTGLKGIHQTYGTPANVFFLTKEDMERARALTDWPIMDDYALTMRWKDDCVMCINQDGQTMYYGDWGIK